MIFWYAERRPAGVEHVHRDIRCGLGICFCAPAFGVSNWELAVASFCIQVGPHLSSDPTPC